MHASILISTVFAAAAFAQSVSEDPATWLKQTNSLGVVTGMPAVITSQPAVVTEQPSMAPAATDVGIPASIPGVAPGLNTIVLPNTNQTVTVSANNSTTVVVSAPKTSGGMFTGTDGKATPTQTDSDATGTDASGSPTGSDAAGAGATMRAMAGGLVGAGAFVAAFL
ncbi:hypothetical protein BDV95DRAFT_598569 [Massariosphaeria phaeospora]|uniref:Uncharacterized protein n=1 Tax=Massariosphaeria phaeospora TaxID=100035 RepID=A0A7C8M3N5_9PLEO|nr:hypothetical protein BDV95DRAFT_598569 [Massariosphaeria phaeospora]